MFARYRLVTANPPLWTLTWDVSCDVLACACRRVGMKRLLEISLGVVISVGGFLEIGSLATAAQGGAEFGYQLVSALGEPCMSLSSETSTRNGEAVPDVHSRT